MCFQSFSIIKLILFFIVLFFIFFVLKLANDSGASGSGNGSYGEQRLRCRAAVYGYDLVGDDFFLEMAKKNLGSSVRNRKQKTFL